MKGYFKGDNMKARDTVMNFMRIEEIDAKNATSNFTDALVDVAREQAEISFKAGVKEVVDWIEQNSSNEETAHESHMSSGEFFLGINKN